jgi:hypothetical protein
MQEPVRHHYVPEMLSKRFAAPDGLMYYVKRGPTGAWIDPDRRSPSGMFWLRRYYTKRDEGGGKDWSAEGYFARYLEAPADEILAKLVDRVRRRRPAALTTAERTKLDEFVYFLWKRTPDRVDGADAYQNFEAQLDDTIAEYVSLYGNVPESELQRLRDPKNLARLKENVRIDVQSASPGFVLEGFRRMGVVCGLITRHNKSFIVASNPVAKATSVNERTLGQPSVEVWVPVASDVCLFYVGDRSADRVIELVDGSQVRKVNQVLWGSSSSMATHSLELAKSLISPR